MAEVTGGARASDHHKTYLQQKEPYQRNFTVKEECRRVKHENKLMAQALKEIRREPPANFHAPKGYDSLKHGQAARTDRRGKESSKQPCTQHHVDVPPWPPRGCESQHIHRARHQKHLEEENCKLLRKRVEHLTSARPRTASNPDGVWRPANYRPPNYLHQNAFRTALFLPSAPPATSTFAAAVQTAGDLQAMVDAGGPPHSSSAAQPEPVGSQQPGVKTAIVCGMEVDVAEGAPKQKKGLRRPRSAVTRVPCTLGMAVCEGCGHKSYHKADGFELLPCRRCKKVWYCSDVCAEMDWLSHKALCQWHTTGHWEPFGRRAPQECWVNNAALGVVRRQLTARGAAAREKQAQGTGDRELLSRTLAAGAMIQNAWTETFAAGPVLGPVTQPEAAQPTTAGSFHAPAIPDDCHDSTGQQDATAISQVKGVDQMTAKQPAGKEGLLVDKYTGNVERVACNHWPGDWHHIEERANIKCALRDAIKGRFAYAEHREASVTEGPGFQNDRASCVGRALQGLREQPMHNHLDEVNALMRVYGREREKEKELERRQRVIEERAYWGLDGPRTCMYAGGKRM